MMTSRIRPRSLPRAPIFARARILTPPFCPDAEVHIIGPGGFFLTSPNRPLALDEILHVEFEIPNGGTHAVECVVKSLVPKGKMALAPSSSGAGCQFVRPAAGTQKAIERYVERSRTMFSELQYGLALLPSPPSLHSLLRDAHLGDVKDRKALRGHVHIVLRNLRPSK